MQNIEIIDNFLTDVELNKLLNYLSNKYYKYGHTSGHHEIYAPDFFSVYNNENFFIDYLFNKINSNFNNKYRLITHYMHIQTFGIDGSFHIDTNDINSFTFCLYITNISNTDMDIFGGDLLIKIPNNQKILCINAINNRGVIFPSYYYHKGMAYNILCEYPRLCLTWKMQLI